LGGWAFGRREKKIEKSKKKIENMEKNKKRGYR
jgi:hypothetical protein